MSGFGSAAGSGFSFNDIDYDNTNTNLSSQFVKKISGADLAGNAKNNIFKNGISSIIESDIKYKGVNRIGNLYKEICGIDNLIVADNKARKGKGGQVSVKIHDARKGCNIILLHNMLMEKAYQTSAYTTFKIFEPKERLVFRLPFYPDRIVHHAIMNILEPVFTAMFTSDTYSCIKGKGIHGALKNIKTALKDTQNTRYCLKLDIRKFYPSVDHAVLKQLLKRKIKDPDLIWLLEEIIDSAEGLPIGNYLSQYLANFYLTYFDHWIKETLKVKYYFRYADDIIVLSSDKNELHKILYSIKEYLQYNLKLEVKSNYQIFPVSARGVDFVGYRCFHTHTLLRKRIKKSFAKSVKKGNVLSIASYRGWAVHADCKNLIKKLFHENI